MNKAAIFKILEKRKEYELYVSVHISILTCIVETIGRYTI